MKMILCALLAAGLLAGCGGSDDDEPDPAARRAKHPGRDRSGGDAEAEIRETFDDYNKALVERDFDDACEQPRPGDDDQAARERQEARRHGSAARSAPTCWT